MKIVIAGAGDIGFHLAKLLSTEKQDIVIIDTSSEALENCGQHLDIITIKGDSSSLDVLKNANASQADLFIAVTTREENNLISAIIAKKLGAKQTIARVSNPEFLSQEQKEFFRELGVDQTISPRELVSQEIKRLLQRSNVTDVFEFEEGKVTVVGILIDERTKILNQRIFRIEDKHPGKSFNPIAILRGGKTIFPAPDTRILRKDHVFFVSSKQEYDDIMEIVGTDIAPIKKVMILGGSNIGLRTAELLENDYAVTVVEESKDRCLEMTEVLHEALIIKGQPSNMGLLKSEGLADMDAVISLTPNTETNIITSLMADVNGVYKTIALVENKEYFHISQNIGVDTLINKKLVAANSIFRFVRKGRVEAICALHGVEAEVIEFIVSKKNRLTKKTLRELHFPKNAVIGAVIRGNEVLHPDGHFRLNTEDKVVVFAMNTTIQAVEKFFA